MKNPGSISSRIVSITYIVNFLLAVYCTTAQSFEGRVLSSGKDRVPVREATVYIIPTDRIDMTRIESRHLVNDSEFDEPLEDTIEKFTNELLSATTTFDPVPEKAGKFKFESVPEGQYYVYVVPAANDLLHLPGGLLHEAGKTSSRKSWSDEELKEDKSFVISLSSGKFREDLAFRGSHSCVECHKKRHDWERTGKYWNRTAHKLGWSVPGKPGGDQEFSRFSNWFRSLENWNESNKDEVIKKIKAVNTAGEKYCSTSTQNPATISGVPTDPIGQPTHLEFGDYGRSPFKEVTWAFRVRVACDDRLPIKNVYGDIFLWKDSEKYYITLSNRLNPTHQEAIVHLPMALVYGGGVHRQRFIVSVPKSLQEKFGMRRGHYTVLQFNLDGSDHRWNKDRRLWRDYKLSFWWNPGDDNLPGTSDDFIKVPNVNKNTIEAECAGCHVTGAKRIADNPDWEGQVQILTSFSDEDGAFDIDQDGHRDEVNVGCESCHGPGSAHNKAMQDQTKVQETKIINPRYLSAERSDLICGRCHDRRQAVIRNAKTQAVNTSGEFFPAGERRKLIVTEYSAPDQAGPWDEKRHLWNDKIHSKSPRQQYSEHVKSLHYKNETQLVACTDCHNSHGESEFPSLVKHDPQDPYSDLCQECHAMDSAQHMFDKGHPRLPGVLTSCISCHMVGTSRPGADAGQYGLFANRPPFKSTEEEENSAFWEGNLNSHVFDVPSRNDCRVWLKPKNDELPTPNDAMPIPYTNSCGSCHDVMALKEKINSCVDIKTLEAFHDFEDLWEFDL